MTLRLKDLKRQTWKSSTYNQFWKLQREKTQVSKEIESVRQ